MAALALTVTVLEVARRITAEHAVSGAAFAAPAAGADLYRVEWGAVELPPRLPAGEDVQMSVSLRNASGVVWPDPQLAHPENPTGGDAVRLSYRWWRGEAVAVDYSARVELPFPVAAGDTVTLAVPLRLPAAPGTYRLQIDLVRELVAWFEAKGARRLLLPVEVERRR